MLPQRAAFSVENRFLFIAESKAANGAAFNAGAATGAFVVINNGKVDEKALSELRITYEDLDSLLRQQEVFDTKDVKYGIMETNGSLSILKKEEQNN